MLEYVPSHFKRVVHVRPKMSCRACETVVQALMPTLPIEKGRPGPALLAHVVVSKFCDHLPLHRQADICARSGVEIDRSVKAAWIPERSATRLREADLNVLSKLGNQGLEWRLEAEAFTGG